MGTLKSRVKKLEDASTGGSFEACLQYARDVAELDDAPWTEDEIQEHARQVQKAGGPWTFEGLLAELDCEEEHERNRSDS